MILGADGISDFNALHSGRYNTEVQLCAFDVLSIEGEDLRKLPLSMRKTNLERLLRGRPDGDLRQPVRGGRDWTRSLPGGLSHGAGGTGVKASRSALSGP